MKYFASPIFAFALLLVVLLPATATTPSSPVACNTPVPAFVESISQQVIMVGELHGTREMPAFAGDLLCYFAQKKIPVLIGFEMPTSTQTYLNAYATSTGGRADKEALLAAPFWRESAKFGLASTAVWDVVELARTLKSQGNQVMPFAFDWQWQQDHPVSLLPNDGKPWQRDLHMGWHIVSRALAYANYKIIILTGTSHAQRDAQPNNVIATVEKHLPVFSIGLMQQGGTAWGCIGPTAEKMVCGIHPWSASSEADKKGFNGIVTLGNVHAAAPAIGPAITPTP